MEKLIYKIITSRFNRILVILLTLLALGGAVMMLPTKLVLAKMLPGKSANTFSIYVDTPIDSTIKQTQSVDECIIDILKKEKEILDMESYIAQGSPLDYAGLVKGSAFKRLKSQSEIVVNLTDKHEREEPSFMMVHRLRPLIQKSCESIVSGTKIKFIEQPSGPPTVATIEIELYGNSEEELRRTAFDIGDILKSVDGLVDVDVMLDKIYSVYKLVPDKELVMRSGLSIDQVNKIIYIAFKGAAVAVKNSRNQQDQIPIFVRLSDKTRLFDTRSKESIEEKLASLRLMNRMGIMVPLKEIVNIKKIPSSPTINRKNLKTMARITAECDLVSQVYPLLEAQERIINELDGDFEVEKVPGISTSMFDLILKDNYNNEDMLLHWNGEMKLTLDTFRDLGGAFIAALLLMFLLMVVYYKSFALSGIVLAGSFLSIIGVIVGHYLTDIVALHLTGVHFYLTATSLIGFISLMGISARSSLLLIDFTMSKIANGEEKARAIANATATRAKPIMLTMIAIVLGSALLATDPIFGGLGIALIFGSMAATAVSLFFVPVLIYLTKAVCPKE